MKEIYFLIILILKCLSIKLPIYTTPHTTQTDISVKLSPYLSKLINKLPTVNLCIGNPIQCFDLSIDLTLSYTILQDNEIEYSIFNKNYNKNTSITYKSNGKSFPYFFQNHYITTNIVEDEITIKFINDNKENNNIKIPKKFPFGLIKTDKKLEKVLIDGFIGLIRNYTSKNENYNQSMNLINYLYESKIKEMNTKSFSLYYKSDNNGNIKGGEFTFGENYTYNKLCISKQIDSFTSKENEWFCDVKFISINDKKLKYENRIYFHSLSPLIKMPRDPGMFILINMMKKSNEICEIISEDNTNNFIICPINYDIKIFDDIQIYFDDFNYYVIRPEYLFERIKFNGKDIYIFKIITFEMEGTELIIGLPGYIENKIIFDMNNNTIGFSPLFKSKKEELYIKIKRIFIIIISLCILGIIINLFYINYEISDFDNL